MPPADVDVEAVDSAVAVNLRGAVVAMNHELPEMVAASGGRPSNRGSAAAIRAVAGLSAYVGTKHGLQRLTKARRGLAVLGRGGVRRNFSKPVQIAVPAATSFRDRRFGLRHPTKDDGSVPLFPNG
jgi:NAD(P)-dependent dehydrogenase (short-subunit alcohol dehydrogenase family)